jgi:hypothetical protein
VLFALSAVGAAAQEMPPTGSAQPDGSSRLFFGPTARMVPPGGGYFVGYGLFGLPTVQVGVTPRFSLGAGTSVMTLACMCAPMLHVTPKFQVWNGEKTAVAVGTAHAQAFGSGGAGLAYVVSTSGTADAAMTIGVGSLYYAGGGEAGATPVLLVGGERRASPSVMVITENYIGGRGGMLSAGFRFHGRRLAFDLALLAPFYDGGIAPAFPAMNVAWRFGSERHVRSAR